MRREVGRRFWVESGLAATSAALAVATVLWRDWIEIVFGVDPDRHSGSLEWLIVGVLAVLAVSAGTLAGHDWRRADVSA